MYMHKNVKPAAKKKKERIFTKRCSSFHTKFLRPISFIDILKYGQTVLRQHPGINPHYSMVLSPMMRMMRGDQQYIYLSKKCERAWLPLCSGLIYSCCQGNRVTPTRTLKYIRTFNRIQFTAVVNDAVHQVGAGCALDCQPSPRQ